MNMYRSATATEIQGEPLCSAGSLNPTTQNRSRLRI
jgi:hypothetical protein